MAISAVNLGTNGMVSVGAADLVAEAGAWSEIAGVVSAELSISHDAVDTTHNDDAGFTSAVYGNTTVTMSVTARFDPSDTAQGTVETVAADLSGSSKVVKAWRFQPIVGAGESVWMFNGVITSFGLNMANNEAIDMTFEVQSTGSITYATDAA